MSKSKHSQSLAHAKANEAWANTVRRFLDAEDIKAARAFVLKGIPRRAVAAADRGDMVRATNELRRAYGLGAVS